jgi:hypothetical protein
MGEGYIPQLCRCRRECAIFRIDDLPIIELRTRISEAFRKLRHGTCFRCGSTIMKSRLRKLGIDWDVPEFTHYRRVSIPAGFWLETRFGLFSTAELSRQRA